MKKILKKVAGIFGVILFPIGLLSGMTFSVIIAQQFKVHGFIVDDAANFFVVFKGVALVIIVLIPLMLVTIVTNLLPGWMLFSFSKSK
jgi:hypothetical protein